MISSSGSAFGVILASQDWQQQSIIDFESINNHTGRTRIREELVMLSLAKTVAMISMYS
jgi:hypothetical protein